MQHSKIELHLRFWVQMTWIEGGIYFALLTISKGIHSENSPV